MRIKDKVKYLSASWMIRLGKRPEFRLPQSQFRQFIHLPLPMDVDIEVPVGKGQLSVDDVEFFLHKQENLIQAQLLCSFQVESMGATIYRGHVIALVEGLPYYHADEHWLGFQNLIVTDIHLVHDEYALLKDTSGLLQKLMPAKIMSVVTATFKTTVNLLTAGTAATATRYLQLYLDGNKQKVLDYHIPQIEAHLAELAAGDHLRYYFDAGDWQQKLFMQFGQGVTVEEGTLKFCF